MSSPVDQREKIFLFFIYKVYLLLPMSLFIGKKKWHWLKNTFINLPLIQFNSCQLGFKKKEKNYIVSFRFTF